MRRLIWVRHGPTHARGMVGWTDLPADLSDTARIARLSQWLPGEARIVSSDLTRAVTTADVLQGDRARLPHDPALREMHFGDWEMRRAGELMESHPDLSRAFWTDPGSACPPGGESWQALTARVCRAVDALLATPGDLVIVAHMGAILCHVAHATGLPAREAISHSVDPLSATELRQTSAGWELVRINHAP
ncbi:histidine phosphatase family protein [Pseudooceanicola nanhaiensis]|uniref:histidine phosphatase family protein n=1 Tax=Pseudooceanicola nanhaiensis TaxID=375761 RepID=UPI001CD68EC8|nr:histidine phosphatase family protein [Pseudooceanicola nanhaiensis]MCA0919433.1 histidine phosphatase family protein [Pseudooceanicola nanhaiensis]